MPDAPAPDHAATPALTAPMTQWLDGLARQQRYAAHTIAAYRRDLAALLRCHPDLPLEQFHEQHIRHAVARLHAQGMQARSLARVLSAWRGFFGWWAPQAGMPADPTRGVRAPKATRPLPRALSVEQAQVLLDRPGLPAPDTATEWRDQALFEVCYSGGLRLAELVSLDCQYTRTADHVSTSWLRMEAQEAVVTGKGGKTRSVPLGSKALDALTRWLAVRDHWLKPSSSPSARAAVFLGVRGERIAPRVVQMQLAQLAQRVGLPMHVHPHSLRHSFASHLLQSAQDLRAVQELLGHANISTTQIYTRLDFQHLAQAYDSAHPRARRRED